MSTTYNILKRRTGDYEEGTIAKLAAAQQTRKGESVGQHPGRAELLFTVLRVSPTRTAQVEARVFRLSLTLTSPMAESALCAKPASQ